MGGYRVLTDVQVQRFLDDGYLVVHDCVDLDLAGRWIDQAYARLGYDRDDPGTWAKEIIWMDHANRAPVREIAPKAWDAILDVVGGEDRIETQVMGLGPGHFTTINSFEWSDAFIVNFRNGADRPWQPPSAAAGGWHKDGSYFRHFLDSRTFIAPDSVRVVARYLAEHPEGVDPRELPFKELIAQCSRFEEVTGQAGDFVILHPFMLHASSQNVIGVPRFMTNPPIVLREPMVLDRPDPADFSLLERATLHYLGLERLDFQPARARESFWWAV
jgi:hypothetical protein